MCTRRLTPHAYILCLVLVLSGDSRDFTKCACLLVVEYHPVPFPLCLID